MLEITFDTFKSRKRIADECGISRKTLYNYIKSGELDTPKGNMLSIDMQIKIYNYFLGKGWEKGTEYEKFINL